MTRSLFLLVIITIFLSLFRLGAVTLFDVDEAVFSEATKEMVDSSNWLTPTYNGENRYDKPILFYWLMAVSYKIFGINEFGARLPSAIASIFLALSVFLFVRHFRDEKIALYSALSCVLTIYFIAYSHAAVTDMTLTLFITLSLFSFYISSVSNTVSEKNTNIYTYAFYFFSALAFLTKGLIGVVFPFGVAMVYIDITEGWRSTKKIFNKNGIILFLLISAPWYIIQTVINGQDFISAFFLKHHFRRYMEGVSGHGGPLYYYIPVLIVGLFPWIIFLSAGIRNIYKEKDRLKVFAIIWLTFIFIFFSLSTTKLPNYVLPAMPAAAILIALGMAEQDKKWWRYLNLLMVFVSLIIGFAFIISRKYLLKAGFTDVDWTFILAMITAAMAIPGLYSFFTKKTAYSFLAVLMIAFLSLLLLKALPLTNQDLQGTLHKYSLYAKYRLQKDEQLFAGDTNSPSIVFYSDKKVINIKDKDDLITHAKNCRHAIAIAKTDNINLFRNSGFRILEKGKKYAILEKEYRTLQH
jgi:4-amino-4-deoxy-L-arabinose transferase-like glycosyltransferase